MDGSTHDSELNLAFGAVFKAPYWRPGIPARPHLRKGLICVFFLLIFFIIILIATFPTLHLCLFLP